jgi:hypothetical protein
MKASIQAMAAIVIAMGCATAASAADQATTTSATEFERQQNVPAAKQGTHESRQAARRVQRAEVKVQARNGELPQAGDDWGMKGGKQVKEGTHASRSADRKEKRGEVKQLVKAGELPVTNEADVSAVKKTP